MFDSVSDLLRWRAQEQPDAIGYSFVSESGTARLSYADLDRRARSIAGMLREECAPGDRVVLLLPPGLDYVAALCGCLYAALVAVPVYPPGGAGAAQSLARLEAVIHDAAPTAAVTSADSRDAVVGLVRRQARPGGLHVVCADLAEDGAADWEPKGAASSDLAFLQYTSGSTATPKGVMVTHGNLLHNGADIEAAFGFSPSSTMVSWLPPYHDMGLIGCVLQPLYSGFPTVLMAPAYFVRRPVRWLEAIAAHRATVSGGPNFAYELCVRKIAPADIDGLDLGGWRLAFNGAEPVRADVMDRFAELLEPTGFSRTAFYPCYGLAEATLFVTGGDRDRPPVVRSRDAVSGEPAAGGREGLPPLVGCGRPSSAQRLLIVDPDTRTQCPDGTVGEIWVAGPSVTKGYWGKPQETAECFDARLTDAEAGPFLRTGDLGFLEAGELFVSGRLKDLIVQHGINHYPQDIEYTAVKAHPALRPNGCAAFGITVDGAERLVVVHEVARRGDGGHPDKAVHSDKAVHADIAAAIRRAVAQEHLLMPHDVVLLPPGGLPRTSSGKVRRHAARGNYLRDLAQARAAVPREKTRESADPPAPRRTAEDVAELLCREVAARVGGSAGDVDRSLTCPALGLDSVVMVELQHLLEATLGIEFPLSGLYDLPVAEVAERAARAPRVTEPAGAPMPDELPLSRGQRGLWFQEKLTDCGAAYVLSGAVGLPDGADPAALERAVRAVVDRHPLLRSTFVDRDGEPVQRVEPRSGPVLEHRTHPGEAPGLLEQELSAVAQQPMDVGRGPLFRTLLWSGAGLRPVLLVVAHHLVADLWSLSLVMKEIAEFYGREVSGRPLPAHGPDRHAEFVAAQASYLDSPQGRADEEFWKRRLTGTLPVLDLPCDRPRPSLQTFRGDGRRFTVGPAATARLRALAKDSGATLYTLLACAYQVLLHRYTGQTDILVGSPTSGRERSVFADTVGYLVNPVVLRGDLGGDPTFRELLERFRGVVADAMTHRNHPFAALVESLRGNRDLARPPVFQTMFVHNRAWADAPSALGMLAAGLDGGRFELGGLPFEPVPLPTRSTQFDLTLAMAETGDSLAGVFQYNSELFEEATVAGLAEAFTVLLDGLGRDPGLPIGRLPLLSGPTRRRVLDAATGAVCELPGHCVHQAVTARAVRQPDAVAIVCGAARVTYRELDAHADRVAARLAAAGAGPGTRVGLCADRSPALLAGLLGILKSGAAYVPLDPRHPRERSAAIVADARISVMATRGGLADGLAPAGMPVIDLDAAAADDPAPDGRRTRCAVDPGQAAYVLYTSGSTGAPKGVVVSHRNVINFFTGMDRRVGCGPSDTMLAVTGVGFDISVLELLWTLARGARVVLLDEPALTPRGSTPRAAARRSPLDYSLFFFASSSAMEAGDRYRLVVEGARFADRHGFSAVWTPERHFHEFGGLFPNPSVLSAALATATENVAIRAGSVVLPLHSPIRVAEEWALVDNLSGGRAGVAFASGWHADDFVFFPERFADRKEQMFRDIETVRTLWRGGGVPGVGGAGNPVEVRIHPAPVQPELPTWITAAGSPATFARAGAIGANLLTHLLGQTVDGVAANVRRYREARAGHGHDPDSGVVTLMLHTFVGATTDSVKAQVRRPFIEYLRSSVGLIDTLVKGLGLDLDLSALSETDMADLLDFAFERYFETSGLFGTPDSLQPLVEALGDAGVTEVACLIDFGLPEDVVLAHLPDLQALRSRAAATAPPGPDPTVAATIEEHRPTLLQSTPSLMRMLALQPGVMWGLRSLRALLLGGETLPPVLARTLREALPATLLNMYGPTETTVWSATHEVQGDEAKVPLGTAIANTRIHVVDRRLEPVPPGAEGELVIGGAGVARGYWGLPGLTAERFVPDPFAAAPGERLYRTGDLGRLRADGSIEFLGRADRQLKIRGTRIEPAEIEAALTSRPEVREAVVVARDDAGGDPRLVAYVVPAEETAAPDPQEVRRRLGALLPATMVPSFVVVLPRLPLTANGKLDVAALPRPGSTGSGGAAPPTSDLERRIAEVWSEVLGVDSVGLYDNFFDLGGHSLLMVRVHARLLPMAGRDLPLIKLLEHPTVSALAAYLGADAAAPHSFDASGARARRRRESRRARRAPGRGSR
ncbi:MupA/Atu3671 family FMN-dependent luciferase-like monooxygenase [Actinomadura chokoriensis]|uniref:LLM class flavin-dependent oxidoreductase n=1 Tax=Actinomadura chokoriensis TaxID=454156 RepID=A0ABV4QWS7_9ACTN